MYCLMRIAVVHSFYRSDAPSGENNAVTSQIDALRSLGHTVELFSRSTDDLGGSWIYPLRSALTVVTGYGPAPREGLRQFDPHVVHVHNLFPNFGTAWLNHWRGPVVSTLHNYRPLCAKGTLFRDGHVCTECISGSAINSIRYGCYRDSRIATTPLFLQNRRGLSHNSLLRRSDRVIVLSERSRRLYATTDANLASRLELVPNGLEDRSLNVSRASRSGFAFVGRVSEEKGLDELLRTWPEDEQLTVAGDGPQRAELQRRAPSSVRWLGNVDQRCVDRLLRQSMGLVVPSRCYEGAFPIAGVEALMNSTPIIALQGSSAADLLTDSACGLVYTGPDGLRAALSTVRRQLDSLSTNARAVYSQRFTTQAWVEQLMTVYQKATASGRTTT